MKYINLLPLAALTTALVVPNQQLFSELEIQDNSQARLINEASHTKDVILDGFKSHFTEVSDTVKQAVHDCSHKAENALDDALAFASDAGKTLSDTFFDAQSWMETNVEQLYDELDEHKGPPKDGRPHHGPPKDGPAHHGPPKDGPPHHGPPKDGPKHKGPPKDGPPHHGPPKDGPKHKGPPKDGPPHHGPPKDGPPHHGPPKDGPKHKGPPKDGPPHHGPPKDGPPHHGPPKDGPPHHGPPKDGPPHHGPPHHGDHGDGNKSHHHPPHHGKTNLTVYELISKSKYTTKLAKLIDEFPDLVEALNGTKANYTVFAPTDKAFERIPEHAPKPSKEQLKALLTYHVSPEFYPAGRVLVTHTIPTLLKGEHLSDSTEPQRLSVNVGLKGLTLNFYSRVVAIDIFGTNGVIHGIDHILLPPPNVIKIIDLLPSEFSTLELALGKTGLLEALNTTDHNGGTFFAPSNFAFAKLGPKINAFLFSAYGQKYLEALLKYHVVAKTTLYSDAVYEAKTPAAVATTDVPKGYYHYDLETLLDKKTLSVDVIRYGGFISIKVNAFSRVIIQDGIAQDGVIQVVSDVLIPPKNQRSAAAKKHGGLLDWVRGKISHHQEQEAEKEMSVEEFKSRFEGVVVEE